MKIQTSVSVDINYNSPRIKQLEGAFDCPIEEKQVKNWEIDCDLDANENWSVGLIVGPSGSGKSTIAKHLFGNLVDKNVVWNDKSVIEDFDNSISIEKIIEVCSAVGFNTIPAWMRPYHVLSTGEKFRVDAARRILENNDETIVIDEFTSVVDRQVAKIASHAIQKYIRKNNKKFVAVGCHYDVIDWLQPDWIMEPHLGVFERRLLRPRPRIDAEFRQVDKSYWKIFSQYHYMSANIPTNSKCFSVFIENKPVCILVMSYQPHPKINNLFRLSRLVTLPDFQGLGIAMIATDLLASIFKDLNYRFRSYPAHPSLIRTFDKSQNWSLEKRPGLFSAKPKNENSIQFGDRPCAVFEYRGKNFGNDEFSKQFLEGMKTAKIV